MQRNREVIVIGGGLTGLTCAWQLKKNGHDVEILERDNRIGGLMQTVEADGFIMEQGPSTGTVKYPEVAELFDDLRGHCEMEEAAEASKCRLIWKQATHSLRTVSQTRLQPQRDRRRTGRTTPREVVC